MNPDEEAWLVQLRNRIDAAKVCVQSARGRTGTSDTDLVQIAADLEGCFKRARSLVDGSERG